MSFFYGLGRKGAQLVQELRKLGRQVIVIEHDPDNDDLQHCHASGNVVVVGGANDEWTLRKAHVHQADSLIAVTGDISAAYLCLYSDADTQAATLTLQRQFHLQSIPIIAWMSQQMGLATLLASDHHADSAMSGLRAVSLQDLICLPEVVLGGPAEILAQSIHQAYLYDRPAEGQSFGVARPMVSWDRLEPSFNPSNRSPRARCASHADQR